MLFRSYNLASSADADKKKKNEQSLRNGGRPDDLFGSNTDLNNQLGADIDPNKEKEDTFAGFYKVNMPWDLNVNYNLGYTNNLGENKISNSSLMLSGNLDLTPKWKIGASSGYDMVNKGVTPTQLRFQRDLESWRMDLTWVPFGPNPFWSFFIGIKSSVLSDIKYDKRNTQDRVIR